MNTISRQQIADMIINGSEWSDQQWAEATGISRQTFWRMRKKKVKGIESKTIELMAKASRQKILWTDHTKNRGQLVSSQTEKGIERGTFMQVERAVIANQLEQIDTLNEQVRVLHDELKAIKQESRQSWNFKLTTIMDTEAYTMLPNFGVLKALHRAGNSRIMKYVNVNNSSYNNPTKFAGDASVLGYDREYLKKIGQIDFFLLYHNDCVDEIAIQMEHLEKTEDQQFYTKGIRLIKSKDGKYKTFDTWIYYTRENGTTWFVDAFFKYIEIRGE